MDKVPVRIRIHTRQTMDDGTSVSYSSHATGDLYQKKSGLYILYQESDENTRETDETDKHFKNKGTQTTWKIEPEGVTLIRRGDSGMRAFFQLDGQDSFTFTTPLGTLPVKIQTFRLEHNLSADGGQLHVGYQMNLAGIETRMEIELFVHSMGR